MQKHHRRTCPPYLGYLITFDTFPARSVRCTRNAEVRHGHAKYNTIDLSHHPLGFPRRCRVR